MEAESSKPEDIPREGSSKGDVASINSDCEPFQATELQLIEDALRSLQSVEGKIESSNATENNLTSSNDLQDLQDVERLLKKVQAIKAQNKGVPSKSASSRPDSSLGQGPPGGENLEPADIRQVVQAAAQTALAAAKIAETVLSSLDRNSLAMEELCKTLTNSNSLHAPREETVSEKDEDEDEGGNLMAIELQQTEIAKSLIRQNIMTHWVLGFIVVSSLVWRFGVIKFVKRINNTIQNPFQGITDMFKPKEDSEKDKEDQVFDITKIFPGQESKESKESKGKDDKPFDLGKSIARSLPGIDPDSHP